MGLSYIDMNQPWVYTCPHLPPHPIPLSCPSAPALSALFHASSLNWSYISHMAICMFHCYSLKPSFFLKSNRFFVCLYHAVLGSITTNNASGGDGIPTELFKILNDDAVKVLQTVLFILRMCPTVWRWFVKILRIFLKKSNGSMEMKSLSKLEVSFRTPLFPMKKHKRIIWPITLITPLALLSAATNLYFSKNYLENVFKWDSGWELGVCG